MSFIKNKNVINTGNAAIRGNNVFGGNIISTNQLNVQLDTNFFYGKSLESDLLNVKSTFVPVVNIAPIETQLGNLSVNNLRVINYGVVSNGIIYNFQSANCAIDVLNTNQIYNQKGTFQQICGNVIQSQALCTNQMIAYQSTLTNIINKSIVSECGNINQLTTINGNINIMCSSLVKSNVVDTREVYTLDIESNSGKYKFLNVDNVSVNKLYGDYANIKTSYTYFANIADCNISSTNVFNGNITNANITNTYIQNATIHDANILNLHIDAIATPNVNILDTLTSANAVILNMNLVNSNVVYGNIENGNITNGNITNAFIGNGNIDLLHSILGRIYTLESNTGYVNKLYVNEINGAQFGNNGMTIANVEMENINVDGGNITNTDEYYKFLVNGFTHIGVYGTYTPMSESVLTITSPKGADKETLSLIKESSYGWYFGYATEDEDNSLYIHDGGIGLRLAPNSTSFSTTSDRRFKKNIEYIEDSLEKVDHINGVYFKYKEDKDEMDRRVGVIAQEVYDILPEAVDLNVNPDKPMTVRYTDLIPLLINSIKELKVKVERLESKI